MDPDLHDGVFPGWGSCFAGPSVSQTDSGPRLRRRFPVTLPRSGRSANVFLRDSPIGPRPVEPSPGGRSRAAGRSADRVEQQGLAVRQPPQDAVCLAQGVDDFLLLPIHPAGSGYDHAPPRCPGHEAGGSRQSSRGRNGPRRNLDRHGGGRGLSGAAMDASARAALGGILVRGRPETLTSLRASSLLVSGMVLASVERPALLWAAGHSRNLRLSRLLGTSHLRQSRLGCDHQSQLG